MKIYCNGLIVSPMPYEKGVIYAELMPATPWIVRKYRFPFIGFGRTYPWQRWWFEIHSDKTHHYEYDGWGLSLRRAIWNAGDAVMEASEDEIIR
jgi:hypothetical protein